MIKLALSTIYWLLFAIIVVCSIDTVIALNGDRCASVEYRADMIFCDADTRWIPFLILAVYVAIKMAIVDEDSLDACGWRVELDQMNKRTYRVEGPKGEYATFDDLDEVAGWLAPHITRKVARQWETVTTYHKVDCCGI